MTTVVGQTYYGCGLHPLDSYKELEYPRSGVIFDTYCAGAQSLGDAARVLLAAVAGVVLVAGV